MSRRLVWSTLAVVLVVVVLLGVPLGLAMSQSIRNKAKESVQTLAQNLLTTVEGRVALGEPVSAANLDPAVPSDVYVRVELPKQKTVIEIPPNWREESGISARAIGVQRALVVVSKSERQVRGEIQKAWLLVLVEALFAIATAWVLATLQARSLGRPLVDLAQQAERLGQGQAPRPRRRRYGIPELDQVADVLDRSAHRVGRILGAERSFAADAAHQLRTPLTALSMRLEEIAMCDDLDLVREEAAEALIQVERLTDTVQQLLTYRRSPNHAPVELVDIDKIVRQQIDEWAPTYHKYARRIRHDGIGGLFAKASPGTLSQVLATLLENALAHGGGTVTVRTRTVGGSVVVEVTDEGPGIPEELGQRVFERSVSGASSTGLGLALARDLAEAEGGRLELVRMRPAVFALFLGIPETAAKPLAPSVR